MTRLTEICDGKHGDELANRYKTAGLCYDSLPSIGRQAINYAKSTAKHLATGGGSASTDLYNERLLICASCPSQNADGRCSECGCPTSKKAIRPSESCPLGKWEQELTVPYAIGVTTSPRNVSTLDRCLSSMVASGFDPDAIVIYADLDTEVSDYARSFSVVRQNRERLGAWRNYQRALFNTANNFGKTAERIMIVQDDAEFARDVAKTVVDNSWPSPLAGVLLLGTPRFYEIDPQRKPLRQSGSWWQLRDDNLAGAMAMVFPSDVARDISRGVNYDDWRRSRGGIPWDHLRGIDIWTGHAMRRIGRECWGQIPSIVDHIAEEHGQRVESTIYRGNFATDTREAIDFIGEGTSAASACWLLDHQRFDLKTGLSAGELVNVIIPFAGDCPDLASSCLGALERHADDIELHVIPVLNGASDATRQAIEGFDSTFAGWSIVDNDANLGFTAAINQGLDRVVRGDALLLNSDAIVSAGCIREMLRVLRLNPKTASVGPMTDDGGHQSLRQARRRAQAGVGTQSPSVMPKRTSSPETMLAWFCTLLAADAIKDVGRPSGHASGLAVDDAWSERARAKGWINRLAHGAFCAHQHSETFRRLGQDRAALQREAMQQWGS